jgi:hypothetical protein
VGEATDEDGLAEEDESSTPNAEDDVDGPTAVWYAVPAARLFVFALVGGAPYLVYWMYRAWVAYRESWGYSRSDEWQAVHARTGFRISPAWRALLVLHCYCLFATIAREAAAARTRAWGRPWLLFALVWLAFTAGLFGVLPGIALQHLLLALAFLPAQLAVNRLSELAYDSARYEPVSAAEILWLSIGVLQTWWIIGARPT